MNSLPPLPATIQTPIGPLPIRVVDRSLVQDGERGGAGHYDGKRFEILIADDMTLLVQWHTLWHERGHMIVDLGGLQMPDDLEETFCWAFATVMLNDMLYSTLTAEAKGVE